MHGDRFTDGHGGAEIDNVIEHEAGLQSLLDAARLLGCTPETVLMTITQGSMPDAYRTPGGHWRIPLADIEAVRMSGRLPRPGDMQRHDRSSSPTRATGPDGQEAGLLPPERREQIVAQLRERGAVRVSSLSRQLGVSQMTVRRDLVQLERAGLAVRAYGGAVATPLVRRRPAGF